MSPHHNLLVQEEPLETWEIGELENWLATLQGDCYTFGETPEDTNRMNAIKKRIKKEKERNG